MNYKHVLEFRTIAIKNIKELEILNITFKYVKNYKISLRA